MNRVALKKYRAVPRLGQALLVVLAGVGSAGVLPALAQTQDDPTPNPVEAKPPAAAPESPDPLPDAAAGAEQAADRPSESAGGPRAEVVESTKNFGEFWAGPEVAHDFIIRNTGTETLEILNVKAQCGCTSTGHDKSVAPGAEGKVSTKLRTNNLSGRFAKKVTVTTNDPKHSSLQLTLAGEAKRLVDVKPGAAHFRQIQPDETAKQTVTITNNSEQPMELKLKQEQVGPFTAALKETTPGRVYELEITTQPPYPSERNRGTLVMTTNVEESPEIQVYCSAYVPPRLSVQPASIRFEAAQDRETTKTIRMLNNGKTEVKITEVAVDDPAVSARVQEPEGTDKHYTVNLSFPRGYLPGGGGAKVVLKTDDPQTPELTVPITGSGRPAQRLVGRPAPKAELKTVAGEQLTIGEPGDDVTFLAFYASWCPHCKRALPQIEKLHQKYKDQNVKVVGVSEDDFFKLRFSTEAVSTDEPSAEGGIAEGLRADFEKHGLSLSERAAVSNHPRYGPCIRDGGTYYLLKEEAGQLNVYQGALRACMEADVHEQAKDLALTFDRALDPEKTVGTPYFASSFPTMYLIGKDGRVESAHFGNKPNLVDEVSRQLDELLAGKSLTRAVQDASAQRAPTPITNFARLQQAQGEKGPAIKRIAQAPDAPDAPDKED